MNFIINTLLGLILLICLVPLIKIYSTSMIGFVVVPVFVFME